MFTKLHSVNDMEFENVKEDHSKAKHIGQYRISSQAVYYPDGRYIPIECITDIVSDKTSVHVSGCCAGGVPVERLVLSVGDDRYQLIFDSKKQIETALSYLNKE